jgi:BirA family biotin operon repressor/biotin-[acetyl-CoA-carboxylase] ligase
MLAMQVLQVLATARAQEQKARLFVSGATLARQFEVSRSAIWKAINQLRQRGTPIEAITHQGYRLALPSSPLDVDGVTALLSTATRAALRDGRCAGAVTSTNTLLLESGAPPVGQFDFITAEHQSAGRGRRGRTWLAPPGGAICLSWSWCFEAMASQMGALSLAVGVAACRALRSTGFTGVQLKWPNDLVTPQGKLGGILLEMRTESAGPMHVVSGIGLNVALGTTLHEQLEAGSLPPVDLRSLAGNAALPGRSAIVAALLDHGVLAMQQFAQAGFLLFRDEYAAADALRNRPVTVQGSGAPQGGIARGVDADGALLVERSGQIHRIIAGEVSVRATTT